MEHVMQSDFKSLAPKSEDDATQAFAHPHARVGAGSATLAYWRFGRGPDVVLVHGWPLHAATFRRIVPELARAFTLHLFDLPGVGQSVTSAPVTFEAHADAIRKGIDAIGLRRYALLAHDSGGVVARLVAADDARVRGLVIAGTEIPGHRPAVFETYVRFSRWPGFADVVRALLRIGVLRRSALGFGGCFTDPGYTDGAFDDLFVRPLLQSRAVGEAQMALVRTLDFTFIDALKDVHARIHAPVLCIWGTDDPFFPIAKARRMLGEFGGGAELVEIAGARLFAHEDHPDAFAAHAARFLARCLEREGGASSAA
jgi:pimeloyl-ACP methyl ester carboxylesterase